MSQAGETALLDELLTPLGECLTPDVARQIVNLRASPELDERIRDLGRRSNEGVLTPDERSHYETAVQFIKFISILQSKSRRLLARESGG